MKLNLAVFTATQGHKWQEGTRIPSADLMAYRTRIGKIFGRFPEPSLDELPFGGAFIYGVKVIFFRFHLLKHSDFKGRTAIYLVVGECAKADAVKLDFKSLFAKTEMAVPRQMFPVEMNYTGPCAVGCAVDFSTSFQKHYSSDNDFSMLGHLFSNCPNEDLYVKIGGTLINPRMSVCYKALSIPADDVPCTSSVINPERPQRRHAPLQSNGTPMVKYRTDGFLLAVVAIVSLIVGGLLGYLVSNIENKSSSEGNLLQPKTEVIKEVDSNPTGVAKNVVERPKGKPVQSPKNPMKERDKVLDLIWEPGKKFQEQKRVNPDYYGRRDENPSVPPLRGGVEEVQTGLEAVRFMQNQ